MKKIFLGLMLFSSIVFSCEYKGVNFFQLRSDIFYHYKGIIEHMGIENDLYCDVNGNKMLYFDESDNFIIGIVFNFKSEVGEELYSDAYLNTIFFRANLVEADARKYRQMNEKQKEDYESAFNRTKSIIIRYYIKKSNHVEMFAKEIYKDHYGSSEFYLSNDLKKTIEKYESLKDNKFTNDIKY